MEHPHTIHEPQREAFCQEPFLSGSDLLLPAAAEAGWGRGQNLVERWCGWRQWEVDVQEPH